MSSRPPAPPEPLLELDAPEATRRTVLAIVALGAAFDLSFNGQRPGIAIPIFALALAASLRTVARRSAGTDLLLAGSVIISIFPALLASPELATLDILVASALLGLAATQDLEPITSATVTGLVRRGLAVPSRALGVPGYVAAPFARPGERGRLRASMRTVAIAVPILALFAALLSSGDRVFARLLSSFLPSWNVGNIVGHVVITLIGAGLVAILWRTSVGNEGPQQRMVAPRMPVLNFAEWATVLFGVDMLFAAFVVVQLTYLFGGHRRVQVTPGLTYAEYARSGFFQLAAAAALSILVILAAWDAGRRDHHGHERTFRALVTTMVGLTGVVLASAVTRLALYEGTFGFTIRRFFGYVMILSIGAALLVLLTAIWTAHRERLVAGFLLVWFAALLAINVLNPERFVAVRNVARFDAINKIDAAYLGEALGPDAIPVTVELLVRLNRADAFALRNALCRQLSGLTPEPSWRSINLGRAAARRALETGRITGETCAKASIRPAG